MSQLFFNLFNYSRLLKLVLDRYYASDVYLNFVIKFVTLIVFFIFGNN